MDRKPTVADIQEYLDERNPFGLAGAAVTVVAERNHLIYRVKRRGGDVYALRMVNPESYRRKEWISMANEHAILKAVAPTGLGPMVYFLDEQFSPSFLIQEFVQAACFNDIEPLAEEHLRAAAQAIALLNKQLITLGQLPFLSKYVRRDYAGSGGVWYYRLADSIRRMPRRDVLRWAFKILPLIPRTMAILVRSVPLLLPQVFTLHFDGAHCGNAFWRNGKVLFLDWQKVSLRNDPTFTLVRFATSVGAKGNVPEGTWQTLIEAYLAVRSVPNFGELAGVRLLERQTADLVWTLWDAARRRDLSQVEADMAPRYATVGKMLHGIR